MPEYSYFLEFVAVLQAAPEVISGCTQFPALEFRAADIHFYPASGTPSSADSIKKWGQ
jgi:hypothetical protein